VLTRPKNMTIRELLMASMMSLVLGGCSISFLGTPTNSAPGNNYGYDWGGKPMSSVDYGQDDREKPLHPTAKPSAPQRDEPATPPVRKKPAPQRTKPTQPDAQPDAQPDPTDTPTRPSADKPTRPSTDKPTGRRPIPIPIPIPIPSEGDSVDKPSARRPIPIPRGGDSVDKPSPRRPVDRPSTKPDESPRKKPQIVRLEQPTRKPAR